MTSPQPLCELTHAVGWGSPGLRVAGVPQAELDGGKRSRRDAGELNRQGQEDVPLQQGKWEPASHVGSTLRAGPVVHVYLHRHI